MWGKWYNFMENQLGWSPHGARHWIQLTLTASGFLWRFFLRWEHPRLRQMQWKISKFHQLFVTELPQLPFGITNDTRQVFVIGGVSVLRVPRAKKQWDTPPEPRRKLNSSCKAKKKLPLPILPTKNQHGSDKKKSAVLRAAMVSSRFLGYKIINEMERTRKFQARNLFEHFTAHNMYQCVKFTLICGDDLKQLVPFPQGKHCNTCFLPCKAWVGCLSFHLHGACVGMISNLTWNP